jgi:hypothetical protein
MREPKDLELLIINDIVLIVGGLASLMSIEWLKKN